MNNKDYEIVGHNCPVGGQSIPTFEYDLAPYVVKSFKKHLARYLSHNGYSEYSIDIVNKEIDKIYKERGTVIDADGLDLLVHNVPFNLLNNQVMYAYEDTKKETYQAMEALVHNLNTMQSRAGAQTPFSSINYGTGTTAEQRLIIQMVLKATYEGLGNGETPIFPVQIFKLKKGINTEPTDPNYDLFEYSLKVTAKRLFPNYINLDASYNLPYYKAGHPETEVASMGCTLGSSTVTVKNQEDGTVLVLPIKEFVEDYPYFKYKVYDTISEKFVGIKKVINNPEETDWYRVKLSNGRYLTLTSNHFLPVEGKGRINVTALEKGDRIKKGSSFSGSEYWSTNTQLPNVLLQSWLEGLIIRDGTYTDYNISIALGMDEKDIVDLASNVFNSLGYKTVINEYHRQDKGNYYVVRANRARDYVFELTKKFRGINKINRNIPADLWNDKNKALYFLAGMIDADGCVTVVANRAKVEIGTINEALSLQTMMLAEYLGLNPKIYINNRTGRKAQYNVSFEITEELSVAIQCSKKKIKALTVETTVTKKELYLSVLEVTPIELNAKSYCLETETDTFDINGVCSHNCRTRVISNVNGPEITTGRGNIAFTTINLPRLAIEAKKDIKAFYASLEKMMYICFDNLQDRYNYIAKKHAYNYPFSVMQGGWINGDTLEPEEEIEPILKQGTLSVGFVGLAECLIALTGKHHGESEQSLQLGLDIMEFMRDLCDKQTELTHLNYSLFATPAESTAGTFLRADRKKFGIIKRVTDKDYYVNSFHVPPAYPISIFNKLKIEGRFHRYCNSGAISYFEVDGDLEKNIEALKQIVLYACDCDIGYFSINHPVDRCPVCGYVGIINDVCPKCGRHEGEEVSVEKLRQLGVYCECSN